MKCNVVMVLVASLVVSTLLVVPASAGSNAGVVLAVLTKDGRAVAPGFSVKAYICPDIAHAALVFAGLVQNDWNDAGLCQDLRYEISPGVLDNSQQFDYCLPPLWTDPQGRFGIILKEAGTNFGIMVAWPQFADGTKVYQMPIHCDPRISEYCSPVDSFTWGQQSNTWRVIVDPASFRCIRDVKSKYHTCPTW